MVSNTGMMELTMKVNGTTTKPRAKELFGMLKVTYIMESLRMTWPMGMESTHILMAPSTKESLETTCRRATAKKSG